MIFAHVVNQKLLFVEHVATEAEPILSHLFGAEFGLEILLETRRLSSQLFSDWSMERLYMEAQDGLKTIAPPLFLNIFFYFLLV